MLELLLGDEAVAIAAIDAGIAGMFSYPGTPATEIMEFVQKRSTDGKISARWSANEKVAYEEALGMSFAGKRSLVAMKHVGLNVAADPFVNSALTGANGALVVAVADDPGMHSSQNEQDTRYLAEFAQVPLLEPSSQQEAYDMTRDAFEYSERVGLPVMIRLVTRLAHSRSTVKRREAIEQPSRGHVRETRDWTLLPVNARRRYRRLLELQPTLVQDAADSPYNELTLRGGKGIVASGIAHNYVREVIGDDSNYSLLKIGAYPLPVALFRELVNHCDDILVVEDGYPYIETRLQGLLGVPGKQIRGKRTGALPPDGEMLADRVHEALGLPRREGEVLRAKLPSRPPALCKGCPHCDTFEAITDLVSPEDEPVLFSDIGCYTLGALPPYNAVQSCVDMGSSISMAHGAAKAGAHPVICTIGDSTFTHSGMTPLIGAAHENADMTVIILDNATVGMTGGQEVFVTGEGFIPLLTGLGVDPDHLHRFEPLKKNHDDIVKLLRQEIDYKGLSVLVACRPCIHVKKSAAATEREPVASGSA